MKQMISVFVALMLLCCVALAEGTDITTTAEFASVTLDQQEVQTETEEMTAPEVIPGTYVTYGHYPQAAKGKDSTPIEWRVLEVDGDRVLLISHYGLDREPYNTVRDYVTWETCSLRTWLNGQFMDNAFTEQEQEAILVTDCENVDVNWLEIAKIEKREPYGIDVEVCCANTQDRIFLLSADEVLTYFPEPADRICAPTDYAVSKGAWNKPAYKDDSNKAAGDWWLRTGGCYGLRAGDVYYNGARRDHEVNYKAISVRPVMWVKLEALQEAQ